MKPRPQEWLQGHHPWCNNYGTCAADTCAMCSDLNVEFPMRDGDSVTDLRRRHFPNVKVIRE